MPPALEADPWISSYILVLARLVPAIHAVNVQQST
jgi:hypothetical protein